ncbi:MAG: polyprenyl synthetase family protein [Planctomycetota bacterium]
MPGCIIGTMQSSAQRCGGLGSAGGTLHTFSIIAKELSQVRALIERELLDCSKPVRDLAGYIAAVKGKMIRPGLLLLSGLVCGRITERHIRGGGIVEMIHNATLLHDDVVDEGTTRRGAATLNHMRGNESAVLLGDFLLSRVFRLCVELDTKAAATIASAAVRTCEGELRQTAQRGNWHLSESQYFEIITEKTAALFSGACSLGAMLAGGSERQVRILADYGRNTGIAFQITDDLLDLTGVEARTGKSVGNDLEHDKLTLPLIHFFNSAGKKEKAAARRLINHPRSSSKRAIFSLAKILRENGSIEYAQRRVEKFVKQAIKSLGGLKNSEGKNALIETARFVAGRTV